MASNWSGDEVDDMEEGKNDEVDGRDVFRDVCGKHTRGC